jgi:hypothetical protein
MRDRRDEFIKERKYLLNVSEHTVSWYKHTLHKWLPGDLPSEPELKSMVLRMREAGLKATGCNAAIRAINCYLKWSGSALKVPKLREPQTVPMHHPLGRPSFLPAIHSKGSFLNPTRNLNLANFFQFSGKSNRGGSSDIMSFPCGHWVTSSNSRARHAAEKLQKGNGSEPAAIDFCPLESGCR